MADGITGWAPAGAWDDHIPVGRIGRADGPAGLVVTPIESATVATLQAAPGDTTALDDAIAAGFGQRLPPPRRMSQGPDLDLVWSGPDGWLAVGGSAAMPARLAAAAGEHGTVVPAPGSRALLRIGGARARDTLAKGCPIDLHDDVFPMGAAATTVIAHMGVQVWRPSADEFRLAVSRSYAGSLWSWLRASGAEYGIDVRAV